MNEDVDVGALPPEESGNRVFLLGTIILGGVFLLALVAIVVLWLTTHPGGQAQTQPQDLTATVLFQVAGTQTSAAKATQQAQASRTAAAPPTFTATRSPSITPTRTSTVSPVVFQTIQVATNSPTETVVVVGTQSGTPRTITPTARMTGTLSGPATVLPVTGFADSAGLPGLLILGAACIVVIILARQLRLGSTRR